MTDTAIRRFDDRGVLVTGAASGIGRATAQRLAAEGATVVCSDVAEAVHDVARAIVADGGRATAVVADVTDPAAGARLVDAVLAEAGHLDVLVNVAGVLDAAHSHEVSDEMWHRIIAVNLTGTFFVTRAALPALLESRGAIVMTASTSSLSGHPWMVAYAASKGGVASMTRTLAMEYARRGLRVNAVAPGGITTPMTKAVRLPDDADFSLLDRISPLDEFRDPATVAAAIAFLASDDAAHVNGEILRVDGGTLA